MQLKITDAVSDLFVLVSAKPLFTGFSSETNIYSSQLLHCFIPFSMRNLIMCLDMLSLVVVGKHASVQGAGASVFLIKSHMINSQC